MLSTLCSIIFCQMTAEDLSKPGQYFNAILLTEPMTPQLPYMNKHKHHWPITGGITSLSSHLCGLGSQLMGICGTHCPHMA